MDRLAKQQTCQLFIEQEIEKGLAEGKSTHSIGREIAEEIKRIFLAIVPPGTIQVRAVRMKKQADTNVSPDPTPQNDEEIKNKQAKTEKQEIVRDGSGRFQPGTPMAPGPGRSPKGGKQKPPSFGMQFAKMAIMDLEKIAEDDTERDEALGFVEQWIESHERRLREGAGRPPECKKDDRTGVLQEGQSHNLGLLKDMWVKAGERDRKRFLAWLGLRDELNIPKGRKDQ